MNGTSVARILKPVDRSALYGLIVLACLCSLPAAQAQAWGMTHGRAVAKAGIPGSMCVMALQTTGHMAVGSLNFSGTPNVCLATSPACPNFSPANACDIYNDSQSSRSQEVNGGGSISARNYHLSGGYVLNSGNMYHTAKVATYVPKVLDPYANREIPEFAGCDSGSLDPSGGYITPSSPASQSLNSAGSSPYVFCGGLTVVAGVTLTLGPGVYIIDSGNLVVAGGGTLNADGATFILTSSTGTYGSIQFNGGSVENVSAPTSGSTVGMALWVDKNAPTQSSLNETLNGGSTQIINGAIYAPTEQVTYAGGDQSGQTCTQLVALAINFDGNSTLSHNCPANFVSDPAGPPKLVE